MAEGLEAAHGKEIVNRDLKPANVKITPKGRVKLLDFALAKMREEHPRAALSNSPTVLATTPGMILGTAAYMSPEQAKGREADRASGVWAFGCIVYEMLAGRARSSGARRLARCSGASSRPSRSGAGCRRRRRREFGGCCGGACARSGAIG
jgi:serine/threonine protein kinase